MTYTPTIHAVGANGGAGPVLTCPTFTPLPYAPEIICDGGSISGESSRWSSAYDSGVTVAYGLTPGGAVPSPPSGVGTVGTVTHLQFTGFGIWDPYFMHINPASTGNGRLVLSPYTTVKLWIYPITANISLRYQLLQSVWFNGAATSTANAEIIDSRQSWRPDSFVPGYPTSSTPQWTFGNYGTATFNGGINSSPANTATQCWISGTTISAGNQYEIAQPDDYFGNQVTVGAGSSTGAFPVNTWTEVQISLAALSAVNQQMLKGAWQENAGSAIECYVYSYGFF